MKLSSPGRQPGHLVYPGYLSAEYLITKTGPDKVLKAVDQPLASNYYFPPVRDWGRLQCRLQLRVVIIGTKPNKHPHWETSLTQHHPPCTLHTNITTTTTTTTIHHTRDQHNWNVNVFVSIVSDQQRHHHRRFSGRGWRKKHISLINDSKFLDHFDEGERESDAGVKSYNCKDKWFFSCYISSLNWLLSLGATGQSLTTSC